MPQFLDSDSIIQLLELVPLPGEGGYFRQTYSVGDSSRPDTTAIYYLVTPESFSSLHRLGFDEIFHFYAGDNCEMIQVDPSGVLTEHTFGPGLLEGARPQIVVPAGSWQGTKLVAGGAWTLFGTTMTPGYRHDIFELPTSEEIALFSEAVRVRIDQFLPHSI